MTLGAGAPPPAGASSGDVVVGVDEEIEGVGSSGGQVMSDGSGESPDGLPVWWCCVAVCQHLAGMLMRPALGSI